MRRKIEKVTTEEEAREVQHPHVRRYPSRPHDPAYCCAAVHDADMGVGFHQCTRKPKIWYGSLGYCKQHDPNAVLKRARKSEAEFQAKWAARGQAEKRAQQQRDFRDRCEAAVRQIAAGHNDPRGLCIEILREFEGDD